MLIGPFFYIRGKLIFNACPLAEGQERRPFQVLCKLKKTDIRCVVSYSEQSRFFEVLPLLVL